MNFLPAASQILRVNRPAATIDSTDFISGYASLDMSVNNSNSTGEGQVIFTSFRSTVDLSFTSKENIYYVISDTRYFKSTGGPLQSTGYLHLRANVLRKKRLSYEGFAQGQYDQGRNLTERFLMGAGARFRIVDDLALGAGVMQEYEQWESLTDGEASIDKNLTKFTSYLTGKIDFTSTMALSLTGYYQTGWDKEIDALRNRVSGDAALDVGLGEKLSLRLRYIISYEDRPVIPLSKSVYSFSTGVKYSF